VGVDETAVVVKAEVVTVVVKAEVVAVVVKVEEELAEVVRL
tara:strand:+ start:183 stop:305 length:123 start_codon:yes stop_codon:yes gene_type:complete